MLNFESSLFAWAGVLAAAGPILLHLLNRQRFRPVAWAAMDFLRQALDRSRRVLHLRDIALLAIRVLCVILFGFTLTRPFFRGSAVSAMWTAGWLVLGLFGLFGAAIWGVVAADTQRRRRAATGVGFLAAMLSCWCGFSLWQSSRNDASGVRAHRQPVHAILLIDNSRSLGTDFLGETLMSQAKAKAKEFLSTLPADSRTTIIPLAGSEEAFTLDTFRHREDAEKALDRIDVVDTAGNIRHGLELANESARQVTELPAKQVVLLTDLQQTSFRETDWGDSIEPLGGLQIVPLSLESPANIWLSDLRLEDGLASVDTPCRFLARLESAGGESQVAVLLRLTMDGKEVSSQTIEISPGQTREVAFTCQVEAGADPNRTNFAQAELELQSDHPAEDQLASDNRLSLVFPVVAELPVVFVDQYGDAEAVDRNLIGETYVLRHLLAPKTADEPDQRRLIRVIHLRQDQLTRETLRTARLVVMAGVERPDACVPVLSEFVKQGGPLVILAGGPFDPAAWQELAWLDGRGILAAPLKSECYGVTPDEVTDQLKPFLADFSTMQHDFFLIDQEDPDQLASIYESTPFFKAVQADVSEASLKTFQENEAARLATEQAFLNDYLPRRDLRAESERQEKDDQRFRELEPDWWVWRTPLPLMDRSLSPQRLAEMSQPRVLAEFKGLDLPFVVERRVGAGRMILVTTGVTSNWNLLRTSGAMYFFHRMISLVLEETLPKRNFATGQRITLPVTRQPDLRFTLKRPSGREHPLPVQALTSEVSGLEIRSAIQSGAYRISTEQETGDHSAKAEVWVLAVNGPVSESDLTRISPEELSRKIGREDVRILGPTERIDWQGGSRRGQGLWQGCLIVMLIGLVAEMLLLSRPAWMRKEPA